MVEGLSGTVEPISQKLLDVFGQQNALVIKNFKPPFSDNPDTHTDYLNEVTVLSVLDRYRDKLPFEIPKLIQHGVYPNRKDAQDPIAFIKMTELKNSLSNIDFTSVTRSMWVDYARHSGQALTTLHALKIKLQDQYHLKRNPLQTMLQSFEIHPMALENKEITEALSLKLHGMEGERVFVHADFHSTNLFADSFGRAVTGVTGVCDFSCSGLGVKELDFFPHIYMGGEIETAFFEGYRSVKHEPLNEQNVAIVRALAVLYSKFQVDLQYKQASEAVQEFSKNKIQSPKVT